MKHEIFFNLSTTEKIRIECEDGIQDVHCCYWGHIFFIQEHHSYLLMHDTIMYCQQCFAGILKKVLANKLKLHSSMQLHGPLNKDIGFCFNESRQSKPDLVRKVEENGEGGGWIGMKYMVWGSKVITWIYNDSDGNIIFELTPSFPGEPTYKFDDEPPTPEEIANSAWYEEWIKSYKPILIRKIPREVAQQWLEQAEEILKTIEDNIARMSAENTL